MANPSTATASQAPAAASKGHAKNGKNTRGKGTKNAAAAAATGVTAPLTENGDHKIAAPSASQTIASIKAKAKAKVLSTVNGDKPSTGAKDTGVVANGVAPDLGIPVMSYSNKLKSRLNAKKADASSDLIWSGAQKEEPLTRVTVENGAGEVCSRVAAGEAAVATPRVGGDVGVSSADNKSPPPPSTGAAASQAPALKAAEHSTLNGGGHSDMAAAAAPVLPAQRSRARNRCRKRNGNKGNSTEEGAAVVVANGAGEVPPTPADKNLNGNCDAEVAPEVVCNGSNGVVSSNKRSKNNDKSTAQQKTGKQTQASSKKKGNGNKQKESGTLATANSNGVGGSEEKLQAKHTNEKENNILQGKKDASESLIQPLDVLISKESLGKIPGGKVSEALKKENKKGLDDADILESVRDTSSSVRSETKEVTNLNVHAEVFVSMNDKASRPVSPVEAEGKASVLGMLAVAPTASVLTNNFAEQSQNSVSEKPEADSTTAETESQITFVSQDVVTSPSTEDSATATPEESTEDVPTGVTASSSTFATVAGIKLNPLACEFTPRFGGAYLNTGHTFPSPDHCDEKQHQDHEGGHHLSAAAASCGGQKEEEYAPSYSGLSFGMSYLTGSNGAEEYNMQPWSEGHDYTAHHSILSGGYSNPYSSSLMPMTPGNTSGHTSGTATPVLVYRNPPNTPATAASLLLASSTATVAAPSSGVSQAPISSSLVYLPHHYHQNPGMYMDVVSRRLESHVQRQIPSTGDVLTSACVSDKAECREGYYVEEQLPASSTISPALLPITASVAGAENHTDTTSSTDIPLVEKATPVETSNKQEGLLEPVADVEGGSGDLSSSKDSKMEACLEKKLEETTGVKKDCLSATVAAQPDASAVVEVGSTEAVTTTTLPVSDGLKSSSSTPPSSSQEVVPNSNGVAEGTEEAVSCSSVTKGSESVGASMSPETSPQMAPLPDSSAQPAAASAAPSSLPGATVPPQLVSPVVQSTPLPNGEAGAEPGTTGDPATDAILKALTPHIQNLFNLKTFMSHPQIKEHLDGELYVSASHLLQITEFQAVTSSMELLTQALRNNPIDVEFDDNGNRIRCRNKRNVVIVRELSNTEYTKEDIKTIFDSDDGSCPEVLHVEYANFSCWYIYFACENDAVTSLGFLNERRFNGRSIQAGIKSSQPTARVPYTPVKPNLPNGMAGSMPPQHQGPGGAGGQGLVSGGPPPPGGMYVGRTLPTSSASGVMPQQQQAPVAAGSGNSCAAPPASLMYSTHNSAVMHNAAAAAAAAAIYPSHYYNLPQPTLFYPSPMMQHYNPAAHGFVDLQQFVSFNGLNPTNTFKPTGAAQLQRFSSNVNLSNNGNKSRNRSRDNGQRTPASSAGPPTPQGSGGGSVHAAYVPQPNPRLFGPPQSAASSSGGLIPYTSQPPHNTNNTNLHYTNAYHPHMPPSFHHHPHHHHQQQQHPVVSMAAGVIPPASSANTSSATFQQQEAANIVPHHANASSNSSANNNSIGATSNANSNSLANQYSSNTALISTSTSINNLNNNSTNTNNSAPSPTSSSSLLREDSARSSPVHINNSRNKTNNTPPLLPCSSINNSSSEGRSHNTNAPLISHPPLISQENAPLMAIPPQSLHANAQNMPPHRNKYNNNMHFNSHHNNQRSQYSGQPGNMHHRNYPPYIYGQPNHYPMPRENMPARPMGRSNGGNGGGGGGGGGGNSGRSNRGRQQRPRDDDGHYHQVSSGGNSGGQMTGSHHQQHHGGTGGPTPRMGGAPGGRNSTGGANGGSGSGGNSANNNSASGSGNGQQSVHPSNDNNASNSTSNNNSNISNNNNSRGNNSNSSRNQQLDRAAQHSSHDSKQAQFALESTSFPPLPGADESEPSPTTTTTADEAAPTAAVAQVASQAVASESVTTPRANFAWGSDVSSTTNGQRFSDIMKKPRSEVVPTTAAPSSKQDESATNVVSSSTDAAPSLPGVSDAAPAVVTAAAVVANSNSSAAAATSELAKSSNSTVAEVVASSSTTVVSSSSTVGAGSVGPKSTSAAAKDQQSQDVAVSNRQSNNGAGAKEQRVRGGRNRRGDNAQQQQQQPKSFNKNGSSGSVATGPQGKSQQQQPKQSTGTVQASAPAKVTNTAVSTTTSSTTVPSATPPSAVTTAAPATTAPATAAREEKEQEAGNKELADDDGWITKKTKEPRTHRNDRKNTGMSHNSHRGSGYSGGDYHGERREERAYYGRGGQAAYKERDTNRDNGSERQQPMLNGNTSPPPAQRQPTAAASTAPSKGKPVKSNTEAEATKPSVNAKDSSSVSSSAAAPASVATAAPSAIAAAAAVAASTATTTPSTAPTVVASPPAEAGEHVKTWANVAGQGSKKIVQTAAVQSQLERKSKDLAMQEKEKERRAAAVRAPRGGGVSRGSERGGYSGRGAGGGRGGNGFVGSTSLGRGQRRPDMRGGEHQGSSYRGGRGGGGGERGAYNRDNKDDHQAADTAAKREPAQYRESATVTATAAAARAK